MYPTQYQKAGKISQKIILWGIGHLAWRRGWTDCLGLPNTCSPLQDREQSREVAASLKERFSDHGRQEKQTPESHDMSRSSRDDFQMDQIQCQLVRSGFQCAAVRWRHQPLLKESTRFCHKKDH